MPQEKSESYFPEEIKKLIEPNGLERVTSAGLTRETRIPGIDIKRDPVFRFERGHILRAYKHMREQIRLSSAQGADQESQRAYLSEFRERARQLEKDLDELNKQFYSNVRQIEVETSSVGRHVLPLVELDLRSSGGQEKADAEGEKDKRIPYFVVGGIGTNAHETAALASSLALAGNKVYVSSYPESLPQVPKDWGERVGQNRTYALHAEVVKETIKNAGLERVNLMGFSMGTGVVMEAASDKNFDRIQDLVVLEPVSIEDKGVVKLFYDFFWRQGAMRFLLNAEQRVKALEQGRSQSKSLSPVFITDGQIISHKHFDPEKLSRLNAHGEIKIMFGTESPIVDAAKATQIFSEANQLRLDRDPQNPPIHLYKVNGGDHSWPLVNAAGLAYILAEPHESDEYVTTIDREYLENSAAKALLSRPTTA